MLLIFDWDGTLCDSTGKIVRCLEEAAKQVGLPILSPEEFKDIIGLGLPEAIYRLYPDISAEALEAFRLAYSHYFIHEDKTPSPFYEGVEETLNQLRDAGYVLSIATGKSRKGLDRILEERKLASFFHGSRCADETASKPNPLMLQQLMEEFRYGNEDAVFVGDTEFDMEMAQRIGMPRVAVGYGAHHISRLEKYEPALSIHNFPDFLGYFE